MTILGLMDGLQEQQRIRSMFRRIEGGSITQKHTAHIQHIHSAFTCHSAISFAPALACLPLLGYAPRLAFWPYHLGLRVKLVVGKWISREPLYNRILPGW